MTEKFNLTGAPIPVLASGEWQWIIEEEGAEPVRLAFGCPCGNCHTAPSVIHNGYIAISREGRGIGEWKWDGNLDEPTLTPSIRRNGACNWHGYLRKGVFESV